MKKVKGNKPTQVHQETNVKPEEERGEIIGKMKISLPRTNL